MWERRQQREQLDTTSVAREDKEGSEDQQEAWDFKCYWKAEGEIDTRNRTVEMESEM